MYALMGDKEETNKKVVINVLNCFAINKLWYKSKLRNFKFSQYSASYKERQEDGLQVLKLEDCG